MNVESFSSVAGNQRELHKWAKDALQDCKSVFFTKENVTVNHENLGVFLRLALFESEMLKKRQAEGREKARKNGKQIGAKDISTSKKDEIKLRRSKGEKVKDVAKAVGVCVVTVCKYGKP
tara:strand:- start:495 stop:854 length:360 start_codon:yes stop_codon:yes gene_type:complete